MPITLSSDQQLWQKIVAEDWNLELVKQRLKQPLTKYPGRPILYDARAIFEQGVLAAHGRNFTLRLAGRNILINQQQIFSLIPSTFKQLQKILGQAENDPAGAYLRAQIADYESLTNKRRYGFYAVYFDRAGEFSSLVQFPLLPVYKLSLVSSTGPLYRDHHYQRSWYDIRRQFNQTHILVAGASVAAAAAHALIRDSRLGALTISDPKGPNATNFNRTPYDVWDAASQESKAIAFARQVHAQDPTQILYLAPEGLTTDNFSQYLGSQTSGASVDLMVEAVDDIKQKVALLQMAKNAGLPIIQIADVGSKAILSINNPSDRACKRSLLLGVSDAKLDNVMAHDFMQAAIYFIGLENALSDEPGKFVKNKDQTPFTQTVPQMGSTALVAAGMAAEQALRFLLNRREQSDFRFKRLIVDKKNQTIKVQTRPTLKGQCLNCAYELLSRSK
jgi:hypothetical protein